MDVITRCSKCNKGYVLKDTNKDRDKLYLSSKINLNPKINCTCGNIYAWNKTEHKFQWTIKG